jgi:hypothetical protein
MAVRLVSDDQPTAGPPPTFSDLPSDRWDAASAASAWSRGLLGACAEDPLRLCPEAALTRSEAAHLAVSLAPGLLSPAATGAPSDVTSEPRAREAFAVLHAGLLLPCQATPALMFCPEAAVTRAELALLLAGVRDAAR